MKQLATFVLFLSFCVIASAQPEANTADRQKNIRTGEAFILAVCTGEYSNAWELLAPSVRQKNTYVDFVRNVEVIERTYEILGQPGFAFDIADFRPIKDSMYMRMSFRFTGMTLGPGSWSVFEIVLNRNGIIGFISHLDTAFTRSSLEPVPALELTQGGVQQWAIGTDTIQVEGIHIINTPGIGMLSIRVEHELPYDITRRDVLRIAIPIVRHAVAGGYINKAREYIRLDGVMLADAVNVVFVRPGTKGGYRVRIERSDYEL